MAQNGLEKSLHVVYDNKGQHMVGMIVYLKKYKNFFIILSKLGNYGDHHRIYH